MATAAAPMRIPRNQTENDIDEALHLVYLKYGSDLGAFFRDLRNETEATPSNLAVNKKRSQSS